MNILLAVMHFGLQKYILSLKMLKIVFQNKSKFPQDQYPLLFIKIAEEIFCEHNFIKENPHPESDKYDLYIGDYSFDGLKNEKVKLVLYKGTKIIHSLFPKSATHNKKRNKKFPFTRGTVQTNHNEVYIPYLDVKLNVRFGILIEKDFKNDTEYINILTFDLDKECFYKEKIGYRKLIKFDSEKSEIITYQHGDLRPIERKIKEINDKLNSRELKLP